MPSSGVQKLRSPAPEITTEIVAGPLLGNVKFFDAKLAVLLDRFKVWLGKTLKKSLTSVTAEKSRGYLHTEGLKTRPNTLASEKIW